MIWLILIAVVAVLLFVLLYKPPVNVPTWTSPVVTTELDPVQPANQPFDLNDLYSGAHKMPQPPMLQPPSSSDQPHV